MTETPKQAAKRHMELGKVLDENGDRMTDESKKPEGVKKDPFEFYQSPWWKDATDKLCADGWPEFVFPLNCMVRDAKAADQTVVDELNNAVESIKAAKEIVKFDKERLQKIAFLESELAKLKADFQTMNDNAISLSLHESRMRNVESEKERLKEEFRDLEEVFRRQCEELRPVVQQFEDVKHIGRRLSWSIVYEYKKLKAECEKLKNTIGHWQIKNDAPQWDKVQARISNLESNLAKAVEALRFYGDKDNWAYLEKGGLLNYNTEISSEDFEPNDDTPVITTYSGGKRARAALAELEGM